MHGIKGTSILLQLKNFDIVWNLPPDYMHGALMGVTKALFTAWSIYLTKEKKQLLKNRMSKIKLPRDLQRALRPLDLVKKYKALEWEIWLLFVSVPCLQGILPEEIFQSYLLFVHSIYILLKDRISNEEINDCECKLMQFVGECEIFYGLQFATFNLHSLLHYCDSVRKTGPLWANSAFPFESFIFQFLREINAPNGCCKQIAEKWMKRCTFRHDIENNRNNSKNSVEYCKSVIDSKSRLEKCTRMENTILVGAGLKNKTIEQLVHKFTKDNNVDVTVFERCIYNKITFHSCTYTRTKKTDDSVIQLLCGKILQIDCFVKAATECYICGFEWKTANNSFNESSELPVPAHFLKVIRKKSKLVVHNLKMLLRKAIVIDVENEIYVSFSPNNYRSQ